MNNKFSFKDQLREIRKVSFARLICNNFDINQIQPNIFLQPMSTVKYYQFNFNLKKR
jgi:hypothetical protein